MPRSRSFQDPKLKKTVLANSDTRETETITIMLCPDGELVLEPCGAPVKGGIDQAVILTPQQTRALASFFRGSRVQDRMGDVNHRLLLKNPATRELIQWIDKHLDADQPAA